MEAINTKHSVGDQVFRMVENCIRKEEIDVIRVREDKTDTKIYYEFLSSSNQHLEDSFFSSEKKLIDNLKKNIDDQTSDC